MGASTSGARVRLADGAMQPRTFKAMMVIRLTRRTRRATILAPSPAAP